MSLRRPRRNTRLPGCGPPARTRPCPRRRCSSRLVATARPVRKAGTRPGASSTACRLCTRRRSPRRAGRSGPASRGRTRSCCRPGCTRDRSHRAAWATSTPRRCCPEAAATLVAAFNGGFKMVDAHGGYYTEGKLIDPLVTGAASVVIYSNGAVTVGAWGTDVTMTRTVVAVRQNLVPLVAHGRPTALAASPDWRAWGSTCGAHLRGVGPRPRAPVALRARSHRRRRPGLCGRPGPRPAAARSAPRPRRGTARHGT